jgi:hypothetical protein
MTVDLSSVIFIPRQTRYCRVADVITVADVDQCFTGVSASDYLSNLMRRELWLPSEPDATGWCTLAPFIGPSPDQMPFEGRQSDRVPTKHPLRVIASVSYGHTHSYVGDHTSLGHTSDKSLDEARDSC